jgi:uncharacterized membrane protein YjjP (DUF1212 family)
MNPVNQLGISALYSADWCQFDLLLWSGHWRNFCFSLFFSLMLMAMAVALKKSLRFLCVLRIVGEWEMLATLGGRDSCACDI